MSRLKRLKKTRNQTIKTVMSSLALTLIIGVGNTISTYAWFNDKENIQNDLSITMGKLNVAISEGFNSEILKEDKNFKAVKGFKIKNDGNLNEKLRLKINLNEFNNLKPSDFKYISYSLNIVDEDNNKILTNLDINLTEDKFIDLKYENGKRVKLKPGETLKCKSIISLNTGDKRIINEMSKKNIGFNVDVFASQVNYNNGQITSEEVGFTDIANQQNLVKIEESKTDVLKSNLKVHFQDGREEIKIYIPDKYKPKEIDSISILTGGSGEFKDIKLDDKSLHHFVIEKKNDKDFNKDNIGDKFNEENQFNIEIKFREKKGSQEIEIREVWNIQFRINERGDLEAYYKVISSKSKIIENNEAEDATNKNVGITIESNMEESLKEECTSDTDIIEYPKEDVENPSQVEKIELSKDKQTPSELEIVAPQTEETEIQ